jgi:glycosyltransferase involved in cell wall biosynthesis
MNHLVSIGLAVYNGEQYIRQALDSLLVQDCTDFELVISDNASTDETHNICAEYLLLDSRVRYYRNQENMGAIWNFNRVFSLCSGKYFMWACHDDYWKPHYLSACLETLNTSESVVLAGTECDCIDAKDNLVLIDRGLSTYEPNPAKRFVCWKSFVNSEKYQGGIFYGIYRRNTLCEVMPMQNLLSPDHLVMAGLCFQGEIVTVKKRLMTRRLNGASATLDGMAHALGIYNQLLIKGTYLTRELGLQKIIFQTDKLNTMEKFKLSCWSLAHTFAVVCKRLIVLSCQRIRK